MNKEPLIILNAIIVNEGKSFGANVLVEKGIITQIGSPSILKKCKIINAKGLYLLPSVVDSYVHFREPGLTYKGDIYSESRAAVAGGTTSYINMPNTVPNVLSNSTMQEKFLKGTNDSFANYSFYPGINTANWEEVIKTNSEIISTVTDDGLYFSGSNQMLSSNRDYMEKVFRECPIRIAIHIEDEEIIYQNLRRARKKYGENIPVEWHPKIRSEESCVSATKKAISIAQKYNTRLHVLHLSTEKEADLFSNTFSPAKKHITAEVRVHHLWFCDKDYNKYGALIKWNPSIKTAQDRDALLQALIEDKIDIVSSDHAPHSLEEKLMVYEKSPAGAPMVQHSLMATLELVHNKKISLEKVVQKMSHQVATLFGIVKRGFIREWHLANLVLVDLNSHWEVGKSNILYKCGWSPFEGASFHSKVVTTIVNGEVVFNKGIVSNTKASQPLQFL